MIKQFHRPSSIEEALTLKESHGDAIAWFSGGAFLNQIDSKGEFEQVISLDRLQLDTIRVKDEHLEIGSAAHLQAIMDHESTPLSLVQAVKDAAPRSIRNLATIGGDIAMGGTVTRLTPCLIALDARIDLCQQTQAIEDYIHQNGNGLIIKLIVPISDRPCKVMKVAHQANADPICTVAVSMDRSKDGRVSNPIIAMGSVESRCRRLKELEETIRDRRLTDLSSIQSAASDLIQAQTDYRGSADYKKYITGQMIAECVVSCLEGGE